MTASQIPAAPTPSARTRGRVMARAGVVGAVVAAHAGVFALISLRADPPTPALVPAIEVELVRPIAPPPPPPPPVVEPTIEPGGGAPAAPSVVHRPPPPRPEVPRELVAPPRPAPAPELIVGASPLPGLTPGQGQGGEGQGTGGGRGDGDGPGSGTGPRFIRGPGSAEITREAPAGLKRARLDVTVALRCVIGLDTRLQNCVVLRNPSAPEVGQAAIRVAETYFRFAPPTANGRAVPGAEMPMFIRFNFSGHRADGPLVG